MKLLIMSLVLLALPAPAGEATMRMLHLEMTRPNDPDVAQALKDSLDERQGLQVAFDTKVCAHPEIYSVSGASLADALQESFDNLEAINAKHLAKLEVKLAKKGTKESIDRKLDSALVNDTTPDFLAEIRKEPPTQTAKRFDGLCRAEAALSSASP